MRIISHVQEVCLKNRQLRTACTSVALLICICSPVRACDQSVQKRRITVRDTIEMMEFADRGYFLGGAPTYPVAIFSPDRKRFLIRLKRGNVDRDVVEYRLLLYETSKVFAPSNGELLLRMASSSNREAIQQVRWLDNQSVLFLGENPGGIPQVYRLDVLTRRLKQLTHHATPVVSYDASRDGQEIVYEAVPRWKSRVETETVRRKGWLVTTQDIDELIRAEGGVREDSTADRELYVQSRHGNAVQVHSSDFLTEYLPLVMSPDGHYAVIAVYLSNVPEKWGEYEDKVLHPYLVERRKPGSISNVEQYMILDARKGTLRPLLDAPKAWLDEGIAWLHEGRSVAVSGAYLPLDWQDAQTQSERRTHPFVVEVDIPSGEIHVITGKALRITHGDEREQRITAASGYGVREAPLQTFKKIDGQWQAFPVSLSGEPEEAPVEVTLEEDKNTPPRIFVKDRHSGTKTLLLDLNPQFCNLEFGKVETVKWQATDGHEVEGGLYFPPDYHVGKRYPLVIQTHGYEEDRFWMNGPWNSAFAAQPLAGEGIMVLQVGDSTEKGADRNFINTPLEGPRRMAAFEGAVDELDRRGLIDREHVGLIGFSRTVFHVAFTLTHSKYRFRAATLADGFDGGYLTYLVWRPADAVGVNGGEPVGTGLKSWLENAPAFNLERVSAPVRIENYGPQSYLGSWEWFSILSVLGKPVDFIWIPQGMHLLVKPWERLTSQQGNVEWFRFWLFDQNGCRATETDTCTRWEELASLTTLKGR